MRKKRSRESSLDVAVRPMDSHSAFSPRRLLRFSLFLSPERIETAEVSGKLQQGNEKEAKQSEGAPLQRGLSLGEAAVVIMVRTVVGHRSLRAVARLLAVTLRRRKGFGSQSCVCAEARWAAKVRARVCSLCLSLHSSEEGVVDRRWKQK